MSNTSLYFLTLGDHLLCVLFQFWQFRAVAISKLPVFLVVRTKMLSVLAPRKSKNIAWYSLVQSLTWD